MSPRFLAIVAANANLTIRAHGLSPFCTAMHGVPRVFTALYGVSLHVIGGAALPASAFPSVPK